MYAMVVFQYNNVLNSSKENSIMTDTCNREYNGNKRGLISTIDTQVLVSPDENPCSRTGQSQKYSQNTHKILMRIPSRDATSLGNISLSIVS
jgi:hypothetical protein